MPSEDTYFKPGHKGGPGRPREATPELKRETKQKIINALHDLMTWDKSELIAHCQKNDVPILEQIIAKALLEDYKQGDTTRFDKFLERVIGKVPQKIENDLSGDVGISLRWES